MFEKARLIVGVCMIVNTIMYGFGNFVIKDAATIIDIDVTERKEKIKSD